MCIRYTSLTSGDYNILPTIVPVLMELNCHLDAVSYSKFQIPVMHILSVICIDYMMRVR